MRRRRFSEEQMIAILREQEAGMKVAESTASADATFYNVEGQVRHQPTPRSTTWKAKYGGLEVSEARRIKSREDENRRLKKLLAEAVLDLRLEPAVL